MFGLTLEKLFIVTLIAGLIVGPHRLPIYASKLAGWIRGFRDYLEVTRVRAEVELGMPLSTDRWQKGLRQYDPRQILREALSEPAAPKPATDPEAAPGAGEPTSAEQSPEPTASLAPAAAPSLEGSEPATAGVASAPDVAVGPGSAEPAPDAVPMRWVVAGGTSGHPRRILIPVTAAADADSADEAPGRTRDPVTTRPATG